MPRKSKKAQPQPEAPKSYDEFVDDAESIDDDASVDPAAAMPGNLKSRDWRDVERFKEERALRRVIDDDLDFEDGGPRRFRR
jgi:hypothetical protein